MSKTSSSQILRLSQRRRRAQRSKPQPKGLYNCFICTLLFINRRPWKRAQTVDGQLHNSRQMSKMNDCNSRRNSRNSSSNDNDGCISVTTITVKHRPSSRTSFVDEPALLCNSNRPPTHHHQHEPDEESTLPIDDLIEDIVLNGDYEPLASSGMSGITLWTKASRWTRMSDVQTLATYATEHTLNETVYTQETSVLPQLSPLTEEKGRNDLDFCQRFFGHPMFSNLNATLFVILLGLVHYVHSGF
jgi:hypothetical protein